MNLLSLKLLLIIKTVLSGSRLSNRLLESAQNQIYYYHGPIIVLRLIKFFFNLIVLICSTCVLNLTLVAHIFIYSSRSRADDEPKLSREPIPIPNNMPCIITNANIPYKKFYPNISVISPYLLQSYIHGQTE